MIEREQAVAYAQEWIDAWNTHDPERVVSHFADDVEVSTPLLLQFRPGSGGVLRGRDAVLSYYRDGLAANTGLHFTLIEVCTGIDFVAIVYRNHREMIVSENLTMGPDGLVTAVDVAYGA